MTREEAIKIWLPVIKQGVETMPELNQALDMAIKSLEQEPCEDAISRKEAIDACNQSINILEATDRIKDLPPVHPKPKTGHWVQTNEFFINQDGQFIYKFICSECKSLSYFRKSNKKAIGANVCPNCGAKMEGVQE